MIKRFSNWSWVGYGVLALLVLWRLLGRGYVLTFDMVFTPHIPLQAANSNQFLDTQVLRFLNLFLPSSFIEKLMLFVILLLAGVGAYRMVRRLGAPETWWGAAFAGVLYMVNPFTYSRLMAGQYLVLAGYALLPWFVVSLDRFVRRPGWGSALRLAVLATVVGIVSIHAVFMLALLSVVTIGVAYARHNWRRHGRKWLKFGAVAVVVVAVLSAYWLVPLVLGHGSEAKAIAGFTGRDNLVFKTDGGILGLPLNVLALAGFWGDRQRRYTLPWHRLAIWPEVMAVVGILVVVGAVLSVRRKDYIGVSLVITALIAAVLAMGVAGGLFAPFNRFLLAHVPLFKGYREPEKFVALIVLAYAYLGGAAVNWVQDRMGVPRFAVVMFALLPILTAPTMLFAAGGQLRAVNYPSDWYAVNSYLVTHHAHKSLFLPWHGYMNFGFPGRVTANMAGSFFDTQMVASDDPQLGTGDTVSASNRFVEQKLVPIGAAGGNVTALLRTQNYQYVVLAKVADWRAYSWLHTQPGLHLVKNGPTLEVWEVIHG